MSLGGPGYNVPGVSVSMGGGGGGGGGYIICYLAMNALAVLAALHIAYLWLM